MRKINREFYESKLWRQTSKCYMNNANHLCERCLAKGLYTPAKIVHHKIHLTEENVKEPAIAYGFDNLEALCLDCHNAEHFKGAAKKRYKVLKDGTIQMIEDT